MPKRFADTLIGRRIWSNDESIQADIFAGFPDAWFASVQYADFLLAERKVFYELEPVGADRSQRVGRTRLYRFAGNGSPVDK